MSSRWQKKMQSYGHTALITGASSGIGLAFAEELAACGLNLVVVARRSERLTELAKRLQQKHGVRVDVCVQDLSLPEAVGRIQQFLAERSLSVDILINNAGYGIFGTLPEHGLDDLLGMVMVNATVSIGLTRALVEPMQGRRRGAIIFVSSVLAHMPTPYYGLYCATKSFNRLMGMSLYGELKKDGIDVLTVLPGYTRTEFQSRRNGSHRKSATWAWASREPSDVVCTAFKALGCKMQVIDGWMNVLIVFAVAILPHTWVMAVNARVQNAKRGTGV